MQESDRILEAVALQIEDAQSDVNAQRSVVDQCETRSAGEQETSAGGELGRWKFSRSIARNKRSVSNENLREKEDLELDEIGNVLFMTRRRSI